MREGQALVFAAHSSFALDGYDGCDGWDSRNYKIFQFVRKKLSKRNQFNKIVPRCLEFYLDHLLKIAQWFRILVSIRQTRHLSRRIKELIFLDRIFSIRPKIQAGSILVTNSAIFGRDTGLVGWASHGWGGELWSGVVNLNYSVTTILLVNVAND